MTSQRVRAGIAGAVAGATIVAGACGANVETPPGPDDRQAVVELPATANRDLDLLFVVDDSVGGVEMQASFKASFPVLLDRLQRVPGGLPSLHLGVVTSDMGTLASGSPTPAPGIGQLGNGGCAGTGKGGALQTRGAPVTDSFLSDVAQPDGSRLGNYTGELATVFGMMMSAGAGGCGFEQPLAAMRAALGGQPANAGFLRPEALLGVVFLTDEDDCSAASTTLFDPNNTGPLGALQSFRCTRFGVTCAIGGQTPDAMNQSGPKSECGPRPGSAVLEDVAQFRDFLLGLKGDPRQLMVTGIIGPSEPVAVELRPAPGGGNPAPALAHACAFQGATGIAVADPAVRLQGFLDEFPDRSRSSTVCQQDLSGGLAKLGGLVARALGSPCVDGVLADVDPDAAGVQLDCIVEDLVGAAATKIEQCDASERAPCWKLEEDAASCVAPGNLKLVVVRGGEPAPGTVTRMRCTVEP